MMQWCRSARCTPANPAAKSTPSNPTPPVPTGGQQADEGRARPALAPGPLQVEGHRLSEALPDGRGHVVGGRNQRAVLPQRPGREVGRMRETGRRRLSLSAQLPACPLLSPPRARCVGSSSPCLPTPPDDAHALKLGQARLKVGHGQRLGRLGIVPATAATERRRRCGRGTISSGGGLSRCWHMLMA